MNPYLRQFLTSGAAALAALATAGAGTAAAAPGAIDLATDSDLTVFGAAGGDRAGNGLATGDFNGDGKDDLIVGSPSAADKGGDTGRVTIVFGTDDPQDVDLAQLGAADVTITGPWGGARFGHSVDAGDVNGDEIDDVVIGAPGMSGGGDVIVIYGSPTPTDLDLQPGDQLGARGFTIFSDYGGDGVGGAVAVLGDVNDDGRVDVATGARLYDLGQHNAGAVHVVFGRPNQPDVHLQLDGTVGRLTVLGSQSDQELEQVAPAGDVDGDGTDDFVIGSSRFDAPGGADTGQVVVYYGANDVRAGSPRLTITGVPGEGAGRTVAPAGDVNGDGYDDIVIGTADSSHNGTASGSAYLVLGRAARTPDTIDLAVQDPRVVRLDGAAPGHRLGFQIGEAGDVNGDGLDDLLLPATGAGTGGRSDAGAAYVLFGARTFTAPDLANLGTAGFRVDGGDANDALGGIDGAARTVRGTGDVNGDGRVDLVLSASNASRPGGQQRAGRVDVVLGSTVDYGAGEHATDPGAAFHLAPKHLTSKGPRTLSITPALPAGLRFDPADGAISGTPTAVSAGTYTVRLTDDQGTQTTDVKLRVGRPATGPGPVTPTDGGEQTPPATPPAPAGAGPLPIPPTAGGPPIAAVPATRPARLVGSTASTLTVGTTSATNVTLAKATTLRVSLRRVSRTPTGRVRVGKAVRLLLVKAAAGRTRLTVTTKGVRPGRYRLTVTDTARGRRRVTTRTLRIKAAPRRAHRRGHRATKGRQ